MRRPLGTLAACLVLAAAACGGDGDDADADFVSQVNAICADYGPKLALIPPPAEAKDEWAAIGADMADLLEASVNELRLLEPPDSLNEEFADWLALRDELAATMRDVQTAGGLHDDSGLEAGLQRVDSTVAEADSLAGDLGFSECSPTGVRTAL
jgi:hypothetical protein